MSKLISILDAIVNFFTRKNERHNRALYETKELVGIVEEFFTKYAPRKGKNDFSLLFENIGQAQVELIAIEYKIRARIKVAKSIRHKGIRLLFNEVHSDIESVKRAILNHSLGKNMLGNRLSKLKASYKILKDTISEVDYK